MHLYKFRQLRFINLKKSHPYKSAKYGTIKNNSMQTERFVQKCSHKKVIIRVKVTPMQN